MADRPSEAEIEALLAAAAKDPAMRPPFAQALLASEVLALGIVGHAADGGPQIQLVHLSDATGPLVPIFTSIAMLNATLRAVPGLDPRFLRMSCRSVWAAMPGTRFVLNPHGLGKQFTAGEIAALLAGTEPGVRSETVDERRDVLVGQPAHVPPRLVPVLRSFFATRPVVSAARLGWIAHPDGATGYLLTVAAPDREAAMHGFGSLGIGEFTDGHHIDVIVEPDDRPPQLLAAVEPFYVRE
jgi:hypothetical protein